MKTKNSLLIVFFLLISGAFGYFIWKEIARPKPSYFPLLLKIDFNKPAGRYSDNILLSEGGKYLAITRYDKFYFINKSIWQKVWEYDCGFKGKGKISPGGKYIFIDKFVEQPKELYNPAIYTNKTILLDENRKSLWEKAPGLANDGQFSLNPNVLAIISYSEMGTDFITVNNLQGHELISKDAEMNKYLNDAYLLPSGDLLIFKGGEHISSISLYDKNGRNIWTYLVKGGGILKGYPAFSVSKPDKFAVQIIGEPESDFDKLMILSFSTKKGVLWRKDLTWPSDVFYYVDNYGDKIVYGNSSDDLIYFHFLDTVTGKQIGKYPINKDFANLMFLSF